MAGHPMSDSSERPESAPDSLAFLQEHNARLRYEKASSLFRRALDRGQERCAHAGHRSGNRAAAARMTKLPTKMAAEIRQAPDVVARQAGSLRQPIGDLVARLKSAPPRIVVTVARGSSAHAAAFAKHLIERRFG